LQEAILLMRAFQNEDWPQNSNSTTEAATTDSVNTTPTLDEEDDVSVLSEHATAAAEEPTPSYDPDDDDDDAQSIFPAVVDAAVAHDENPMVDSVVTLTEALMKILQQTTGPKALETALEGIQLLVTHRYVVGSAGEADSPANRTRTLTDHSQENGQAAPPAALLHRLLEAVHKAAEINAVTVHTAVVATLKAIVTSPKCGIHESSMLLALRSTFHVYLVTKASACQTAARQALLEILRSVFARMEAHEAVTKHQAQYRPPSTTPVAAAHVELPVHVFASQYHSDSYVLFRALCKLSSKELPADTEAEPEQRTRLFSAMTSTADPLALNSKILSLELILAAFDYCGEAFYNGERFIHLVQHYLCSSLLKNCMSNNTKVAFLSQKIFLNLVHKFKVHLKQEIEVFLSNIFLKVLDSPNSSFKQKALVLESLRSLCQDSQLLTQIFLHYDCDFDALNLYKDIVHMLTKLAGRATSNPNRTENDWELSLAGLEVLVTILKSNLRALGLPVAQETDDSAGAKIRGMLQLDVGLAVAATKADEKETASVDSSLADDISIIEIPSASGGEPAAVVASTEPVTNVAERINDAFEMKRNAEQNFEIGAVKFTLSLKGGLNYFFENGLVQRRARDVALFFLQHKEKLDKTQMGEALGREPDAALVKEKGLDPEEGGPGFWTLLLHHYVDSLNFTDMVFDDAIRLFLSGFRLPGEAQKIDRIMEKFAEKFTSQNPAVFPSADTAFILAFSVIMLNTDLHNPSIKPERRMTLESFIRNNRGIGENGEDMPEEVLGGIFQRIKERPFSLKEDDAARERAQKQIFDTSVFFEGSNLFGASVEQRKREVFKKEKDEMMAATGQLMRRRPERSATRTQDDARLHEEVSPADVVKPMFDVTWGPLLGILSQVLECSDDERSTSVCLNGFVYAVRIAAHSGMSLARDTFVSSLAKFTFLGSIKNMKRKNIESVRTLLSIAVIDGEYLGASWEPVLQCISQVARLRLSASGLDSDESFLSPTRKRRPSASNGRDIFRSMPTREGLLRETEASNGKAVLEAVQEVLIDKVFQSTVNLSAKTLAHFIEQLIAVSESEIAGTSKRGITGVDSQRTNISRHGSKHGSEGPSIFSLQRLVDVADFNMDVRPRLVWAQVWEMMADYFAKIACHDKAMVSVFAVDSLKQLSFKFLDKPELTEFNFQRIFLKPFLVVMEEKSSREEVREMVLHCIDNMIRTKSHNLRSGWKVVFSILDRSASDPSEKIDFLGLGILQRLLDEHLHEICRLADTDDDSKPEALTPSEMRHRNSNVEEFVELCRASLSFVGKEDTDSPRPFGLAMRAFCHTGLYADLLATRRVLPPVSGAQTSDPRATGYTYRGLSAKESLEMAPWRPLLEGLAEGVRSNVRNVVGGVGCLLQRGSILALRAILLRHGHVFSAEQLAAIIEQTLIPSIQAGAESDRSPVTSITSESPAVSSIDFLAESLPLPPPTDDPSLQQFWADLESSSKRSLGPAELMLEASFTVLRHGGDGDLRKAGLLAKKGDDSERPQAEEQPFPESWIATTAPGALGLLTDIVTEVALHKGPPGWEKVWPVVAKQVSLWCIGPTKTSGKRWEPCEALVRVSCGEMHKFVSRVSNLTDRLSPADKQGWSSSVLALFSEILLQNAGSEDLARSEILRLRHDLVNKKNEVEPLRVKTLYGTGQVQGKNVKKFDALEVEVHAIKLDFGATLYTTESTFDVDTSDVSRAEDTMAYGHGKVTALKIGSVAAHCLNQSLVGFGDQLIPFVSKYVAADVLESLSKSRTTASVSAADDELAMAFQEAMLSDWGDAVADVQEAIESSGRLSQLHGSAMFFLTQEAGATQAALHILSKLYSAVEIVGATKWDKESFAESHMFYIINDVLDKFLASEKKDGHLIDPNVWRNAGATGVKVAIYCTSFASVVLEILSTVKSMQPEQFSRHKQDIFPRLCALVRVHSDEIREAVHDVLMERIGPMIHVFPQN
jgi:Sec7-like guanine-nucleotide exchange factor